MTNNSINDLSGSSVLADVLSSEQIARLKEHWIETPDQFIAAVATEEGKAGMCRLLALDELQLKACVKRFVKGFSPDVVKRLQSTRPGGELGAILPKQPADKDEDDVEQGGGT